MAKIDKLPSGTYRTRVYLGTDKNGKKLYKSITHPDKLRLQLLAAEYQDANKHTLDRRSFQKAVISYISIREKTLSPATIRAYTSIKDELIDKHKDFCELRLDQIDRITLQDLVLDLQAEGKAPKTVRNYVGLVSAVLRHYGYRTPVITLPKRKKSAYYIPEESTMMQIVEKAKGTKMEVPLALAMLGLRRGEICGLQVEDLNGTIIHIHRNMVYDHAGQLHVKDPKTYLSDRMVEIPQHIADKIREQGFVTEYTPRALTEAFTYFLKKHGFQHFRLHDCRHFFVSYCHNVLKLSDAQIMKLGGYQTDHVMKNHYLHSMDDAGTAHLVASKYESFFSG